tara:strand:+ start:93 stop:236 length:144 start_codon:yes stop_codon:yes gene_type:complete
MGQEVVMAHIPLVQVVVVEPEVETLTSMVLEVEVVLEFVLLDIKLQR